MTDPQQAAIDAADPIAPAWFFACWLGYTLLADRTHARRPSLMESMAAYRRLWMRRMLERDNRIIGSQIVGNLMRRSSPRPRSSSSAACSRPSAGRTRRWPC